MGTSGKSIPSIDTQSALAAQAILASQSGGPSESSGVDKMRELLFGNQMQDYDKRFSVLEDRFAQRLRDLETESSRSLGSLESTMKKQLESVAGQFREEKDLRSDADKELERNMREHTQALEKRLAQSSDQLARLEREFTDRLAQEVQGLRDEMRKRQDDTRTTVERMFGELSNVKTDRNLLASSGGFTPYAYNLGVAVGWKHFAVTSDYSKVDLGAVPGSHEAADVALSYGGKRWSTRLALAADRSIGDTSRLLGSEQGVAVDLGGSYSITNRFDVTGGVRYKVQKDGLMQLSDDRRDSQAVYIGTAFKF